MKVFGKTQRCWLSCGKIKSTANSEGLRVVVVFVLHKDKWSKFADLFCNSKRLSVESYLANSVFLRK